MKSYINQDKTPACGIHSRIYTRFIVDTNGEQPAFWVLQVEQFGDTVCSTGHYYKDKQSFEVENYVSFLYSTVDDINEKQSLTHM